MFILHTKAIAPLKVASLAHEPRNDAVKCAAAEQMTREEGREAKNVRTYENVAHLNARQRSKRARKN